ncbi:MAG: hypothetical protein LC104_02140 [Bacteroidales bacterium]|nr:hypothetical protein [Bacteroidales bacterium]
MTKPSPSVARTATAYHEAGHAVIALLFDRPIQKITIRADRDHLGWCKFDKGVFRPSEDWIEREVLIALAGMAAEAQLTGRYCEHGASRDLRYARRLLAERAGGERRAERLERRLLAKVESLLGDEGIWSAVTAIATELLQSETISGRAARHLFAQHVETE